MQLRQVLIAFSFASIGFAQPTDHEIPVVTVCDVLSDLARYNGKSIVLVGLQWGTDEGVWVDAKCDRKLVTNRFTWPDSIAFANYLEEGANPPRLPDQFTWNNKLIAAKLNELKRTTRLSRRNHERWVAIFGRLEANVPPQTFVYPNGDRRGAGFGHLSGAPAQIMLPVDYRKASRTLH
jgi:hypothetical protein